MALNRISKSLRQRILSSLLLAPFVILLIYYGGAFFNTLIIFMTIIMTTEWMGIITNRIDDINEPITPRSRKWTIYGILYVGIFASSLIYLRSLEEGLAAILFLVLLVWTTDIAAYFTGKMIGGPKIWKSVSPNKTWAGLIGAMIATGLVGIILSIFMPYNYFTMFVFGALVAVIAQIGDFMESALKRKFKVKDSGNIIPGHGGIMDRMDGFVTVTPIFTIISLLNNGDFLK